MAHERMFPPIDAPSRATGFSAKFDADLQKQRRSLYPERWVYEGDDNPVDVDDPSYEGMGYIESAGNPLNKLKPGPYYLPSKNKRIWLSEDGSVRHIPEPTVEIQIADWAKPMLAAVSPILLPLFIYEYATGHKTRSLDSTPQSENIPVLKDIPIIKDINKGMLITAGMLLSVALPVAPFVLPVVLLGILNFGHEKIKQARFDEMDFLIAGGAKSLKITGKTDAHGNPMPHDKKLFMQVLRKAASYGVPVSLDKATLGWVHTLPTSMQTEIMGIVDATKLNQAKIDLVTKLNAPTSYKEKTKALNETAKLTDVYSDEKMQEKLKADGKTATPDELNAERKKAYLADVADGSVRTKLKGINAELEQIKARLENLDAQGKELSELQNTYADLLDHPEKFANPVDVPERLKKYVDANQREALMNPAEAVAEIEGFMKVMEKPLDGYMQARANEYADLDLRLETLGESWKTINELFTSTPAATGSEAGLKDDIKATGKNLEVLVKLTDAQGEMNKKLGEGQVKMKEKINETKADPLSAAPTITPTRS